MIRALVPGLWLVNHDLCKVLILLRAKGRSSESRMATCDQSLLLLWPQGIPLLVAERLPQGIFEKHGLVNPGRVSRLIEDLDMQLGVS